MLRLTDLTVNGLETPLGIAGNGLRFGWKLATDTPDTVQVRYRVTATGEDEASRWDSGDVGSDRSVAVRWGGAAPGSCERIEWTVRVRDNHGREAEATSSFETGLLRPDDWQGRFIEISADEDPDRRHPASLFRRTFELEKSIVRARLYATAHGIYEARCNGRRVSDALLTPGFTVYDRRLQVQTYDLTALVRTGENAIGAIVTDGWYRGCHGASQARNSFGTRLAFLAQLEVTFEDASTTIVATDSAWRSGQGAIRFSDLHLGMVIDAAMEPVGWDAPGFDDASWQPVRVADHDLGRLRPQEGPVSRVMCEIHGARILTTPDGSTVVDFGQNLAGHVRFSVVGPPGHEIRMLPVETLDEKGNPDPRTTVMPRLSGALRAFRLFGFRDPELHRWIFRLAGGGPESFDTRHTYTGFRYLVVEGWPGALSPGDLTACVVHSEVKEIGRFECSDPRLERLQQNVLWTQRANFVEVPTDCPAREKAGWTGDLWAFVPTATFNQDVSAMLGRWMKDVAADQEKRGDGIVTNVVPNTRCYRALSWADGSAAWADAVVKVPWALYCAFGDPTVLAESYQAMVRWIEFCDRRARKIGRATFLVPRRLLDPSHWRRNPSLVTAGYHWGDWLRPNRPLYRNVTENLLIPPVLEATTLFAMSLDLLARIAAVLERKDDEERFRKRHGEVVEAFREEFVRPEGRMVIDEQYAYVLALAADLLPVGDRPAAADRLATLVRANGYRLATGFVATPHLLFQLTRFGHHDVAADLAIQDAAPSWLYAVDRGATTVWETWNGVAEDGRVLPVSQNHYAFGSVGNWLYEELGGLQPIEPGYRRIRIAPRPACGLRHCLTEHETPYGVARSEWRIKRGRLSLDATVPPNTRAEIVLPGAEPREVGSGAHHFERELDSRPREPTAR